MTAVVIFAKNEERVIGRVIDDLKICLYRSGGDFQVSGINCFGLPPAGRSSRASGNPPHPDQDFSSNQTGLKSSGEGNIKFFLCDDSTDKTAEIAASKGVEVIKGSGKGLGWSYYLTLHILLHRRKERFDSIITLDGDGQTDLTEAPHFYREFKNGYDLIAGSRFLKKNSISYRYSKVNFMGVKILAFMISVSALRRFSDSHGGLRVMSASVAEKYDFSGGHSYVQETLISAANRGFKIKELPSKWNKRLYGESRVVRSKIKYMKAMAWPLLIRTRIHWGLSAIALPGFILSGKLFYAGLFGFCCFMELYKQVTFRINNFRIKRQAQKYSPPRSEN